MSLRRLLPTRLRHHSRILAIQCGQCRQWRKPRHIRIPAIVCRDCETLPDFQDWKPSAESVNQPVDPQPVRIR